MKYTSTSLLKSSKQEWETVDPRIKRKITGNNDNMMMVLVKFEKGGIGDLHSHVHTQSTYIESGAFEVTIAGELELLVTGDCFLVPPNAVHGVVCTAAEILVCLNFTLVVIFIFYLIMVL